MDEGEDQKNNDFYIVPLAALFTKPSVKKKLASS
jgi:hypothetical protein